MVIWITGYSSSGKTTIARKLRARLAANGSTPVVLLDGDDLRNALDGQFGYNREERIRLAYVYLRLCNTLAEQGVTVIISAVAMYREVFQWAEDHINNIRIIYLRVPLEERRKRDEPTKGVYKKISNLNDLYDEPTSAALVIDNYGDTTPNDAVNRIVQILNVAGHTSGADHKRKQHWKNYYLEAEQHKHPTTFAKYIASKLAPKSLVVDVGCGNGRDTIYFAEQGHATIGVDVSSEAIDLCKSMHNPSINRWVCGTINTIKGDLLEQVDAIYSRFSIHAMTLSEEMDLLSAAQECLKFGGNLFIECRSINDPLARHGEFISATERSHGHYRRFIVLEELVGRLASAGFLVIEKEENEGLAILGAENPSIIRIVAVKLSTE